MSLNTYRTKFDNVRLFCFLIFLYPLAFIQFLQFLSFAKFVRGKIGYIITQSMLLTTCAHAVFSDVRKKDYLVYICMTMKCYTCSNTMNTILKHVEHSVRVTKKEMKEPRKKSLELCLLLLCHGVAGHF